MIKSLLTYIARPSPTPIKNDMENPYLSERLQLATPEGYLALLMSTTKPVEFEKHTRLLMKFLTLYNSHVSMYVLSEIKKLNLPTYTCEVTELFQKHNSIVRNIRLGLNKFIVSKEFVSAKQSVAGTFPLNECEILFATVWEVKSAVTELETIWTTLDSYEKMIYDSYNQTR